MGLGVEQDAVGGQGRGDVGESELDVALFTRTQRIRQLVFVKIDQCRRTGRACQHFEIRQAHQVGGDQAVVSVQRADFFNQEHGRAAHTPFPESGRQGNQVDTVMGVGHQTLGKLFVAAAEKRFDEQKAHDFPVMVMPNAKGILYPSQDAFCRVFGLTTVLSHWLRPDLFRPLRCQRRPCPPQPGF